MQGLESHAKPGRQLLGRDGTGRRGRRWWWEDVSLEAIEAIEHRSQGIGRMVGGHDCRRLAHRKNRRRLQRQLAERLSCSARRTRSEAAASILSARSC